VPPVSVAVTATVGVSITEGKMTHPRSPIE
jgi:hypothetical protein